MAAHFLYVAVLVVVCLIIIIFWLVGREVVLCFVIAADSVINSSIMYYTIICIPLLTEKKC